jgi:hypothetical protein
MPYPEYQLADGHSAFVEDQAVNARVGEPGTRAHVGAQRP